MRVIVCGDRNWGSFDDITISVRELVRLPKGTVVIHGDYWGADRLCGAIAKGLGFEVITFPANWKKHGSGAGPIRNRQMLEEGKPDKVIAFHPDLSQSKGTKHMVEIARAAGIPVEVYDK